MSDGRVVIDILADSSRYESAVARLGSATQSAFGAIGSVASAALKTAAAGAAAAAAGAAWMGKEALGAYSDYEQLSGGVAKLYGNAGQSVEEYAAANNAAVDDVIDAWNRNESAQSTVMANAADAYRTCGMSANQYMEQATSFSASLVNSLGGDTQKAAEMTDVAMRAMSDNVNTFGTNMTDVQNAFQGFSKQNYTMLDNLKLGYGGTKEEMQRLIDDANEWGAANGEASDLSIDSFADVVQAIQQIQEKQQVAGTTAREAATTIEGSVNMAKAAWQNWLAGLGNDAADMGQLTTQLVDSLTTAAGNIIPRIDVIFTALLASLPGVISEIAAALPDALGSIADNVVVFLEEAIAGIPDVMAQLASGIPAAMSHVADAVSQFDWSATLQGVLEGVSSAIDAAAAAIAENGPAAVQGALDGIGDVLSQIAQLFVEVAPGVIAAIAGIVAQAASYVGEHAGDILQVVADEIVVIAQAIADNAPTILAAAGQMLMGIVQALPVVLPQIAEGILSMVLTIATYLVQNIPAILAGALQMFGAIVIALNEVATLAVDAVYTLVVSIVDIIIGWVATMASSAAEAGAGFLAGLASGLAGVASAVGSVLAEVISGVSSWAASMLSEAAGAGAGFLSSLVSGISGIIGGVSGVLGSVIGDVASFAGDMAGGAASAASEFADNIMSGLSSIPGQVADIGGQIVQGLINGITGGAASVAGAIADVANGAVSAAKSALGIASPSKVFRGIGEYVSEGLSIGIEAGSGVEDAVRSLAGRAVDAWDAALSLPDATVPPVPAFAAQAVSPASRQDAAADAERHSAVMAKLDALLSAVYGVSDAASAPVGIALDKREVGRLVRDVM